jgi:hypothetical protein
MLLNLHEVVSAVSVMTELEMWIDPTANTTHDGIIVVLTSK